MERFFTYFSIKFDNLHLKWNFLRIWLWKWKKWILFYERSPSQIILIENTKLFFFFFLYIYNLSNKKCVYIIKKRTYVYIYICVEVILINVLASHLAPPNKNSWLRPWRCVTSVKYVIRINGQPCDLIQPTRRLRQGDPLSPYLFLICVEGLSALLHLATHRKAIKGVAASARGPRVSHLFFANDSLVFGRASVSDAKKIQRILKVYELSSG